MVIRRFGGRRRSRQTGPGTAGTVSHFRAGMAMLMETRVTGGGDGGRFFRHMSAARDTTCAMRAMRGRRIVNDGGRVSAVIEVLSALARQHRPLTEILRDWGKTHRFAGSADRAAIGTLAHDALRHRALVAWRMGEDTPRALAIGTFAIVWGNEVEAINAAFAADRFAPEPLSEAERKALERDGGDAPDHVRGNYPRWLGPSLRRVFGPDAVAEGMALAQRAPLDLRVNTVKADRGRLVRALARHAPSKTPFSPIGLRIAAMTGRGRRVHVESEPAHRRGLFEIQDEGSQLAALVAGARPGDQVLDLCAGAGGKTLALAAAMENRGQIHAHDADRRRLAPIFARLKRAGIRNVQVIAADDRDKLDALAGRMDLVLIDAPCSGSGVWRRRPDAKWRLRETALERRIGEQAALLGEARRHVRRGGRLVYVTCSILPEENEDQIAAFLEQAEDFRLADPAIAWREAVACPLPERLRAPIDGHGAAIRLTPARAGTDGFFIAVMQRS